MLPQMQREFAQHHFTPQRYERFRQRLEQELGCRIEFRICEAPIFVSDAFRRQLEQIAVELTCACATPEYRAYSEEAVPPQYRVPGEPERPLFAVVDFAIVEDSSGALQPRVVELQGFPSLFGYQYFYARLAREVYELGEQWSYTLGELSDEAYLQLLQRAILGDCAPEEVVLLEYRPWQQKTLPDFLALRRLIGIEPVDVCELRKQGKRLYRRRGDAWVPVRRIFHRVVMEELEQAGVELPFEWTEELEVEWAGHPSWYFRMSKFALPYLKHPAVPPSWRLSELATLPERLEEYVLKPLFSFAGRGVVLHPTREQVEQLPPQERRHYLLQQRLRYAPCIYTPVGMNTVELRVMLIWLAEWEQPLPVMAMARTGRAELHGVGYNTMPWAGSSGCLFAPAAAGEHSGVP